jgi:hypothetical protein
MSKRHIVAKVEVCDSAANCIGNDNCSSTGLRGVHFLRKARANSFTIREDCERYAKPIL